MQAVNNKLLAALDWLTRTLLRWQQSLLDWQVRCCESASAAAGWEGCCDVQHERPRAQMWVPVVVDCTNCAAARALGDVSIYCAECDGSGRRLKLVRKEADCANV